MHEVSWRQRGQLPSPARPLIGRAAEIRAALDLLRNQHIRLLTLVGRGGVGKTRLATAIAAAAADTFADGVVFVDLSPLRDARLVVPSIAAALNIADTPARPLTMTLNDSLNGAQLLLVLDNFEQVQAAAAEVGALLAECRGLHVIATSRGCVSETRRPAAGDRAWRGAHGSNRAARKSKELHAMRHAVPPMAETAANRVNIASTAWYRGWHCRAAYTSSTRGAGRVDAEHNLDVRGRRRPLRRHLPGRDQHQHHGNGAPRPAGPDRGSAHRGLRHGSNPRC